MELKDSAVGLVGSSVLLLAMGLFTHGIVFYAFFAATVAVFAADIFRYSTLVSDLRRNLSVKKTLSGRELFPGVTTTLDYEITYHGGRRLKVRCEQRLDPGLSAGCMRRELALQNGSQQLSFDIRPARRGSYRVPGLRMTFDTMLFRGTVLAGSSEDLINVYMRSGSDSSHAGRAFGQRPTILDNEAVRHGSGIDFSYVRNYMPGDSTRNIDWARSSKAGTLIVRGFEDVRSLPVFILIDIDASMDAEGERTGLSAALELASLLANHVLTDNERIGLACFSPQGIATYLPLGAGKDQALKLRSLFSNVQAIKGNAFPRQNMPGLQEAAAVKEVLDISGLGTASAILDEAMRQHTMNVRADGFIKAITQASVSSGTICHMVVVTNLSMGATSLMNGLRIAGYYGHSVSVVLTPSLWYGPKDAGDAGKYFEQYREIKDKISGLRARNVSVVELSACERPEEVLYAGRKRGAARARR